MLRLKEIQANRKRMVDGIIGQMDERETLVQGLVAKVKALNWCQSVVQVTPS